MTIILLHLPRYLGHMGVSRHPRLCGHKAPRCQHRQLTFSQAKLVAIIVRMHEPSEITQEGAHGCTCFQTHLYVPSAPPLLRTIANKSLPYLGWTMLQHVPPVGTEMSPSCCTRAALCATHPALTSTLTVLAWSPQCPPCFSHSTAPTSMPTGHPQCLLNFCPALTTLHPNKYYEGHQSGIIAAVKYTVASFLSSFLRISSKSEKIMLRQSQERQGAHLLSRAAHRPHLYMCNGCHQRLAVPSHRGCGSSKLMGQEWAAKLLSRTVKAWPLMADVSAGPIREIDHEEHIGMVCEVYGVDLLSAYTAFWELGNRPRFLTVDGRLFSDPYRLEAQTIQKMAGVVAGRTSLGINK
ncbi:hypothetical protein B0H10DRAFT_1958125 [Mycena sp. CBHHK59/15]|nr:hypothetical protein B0H10DRAFT_1958125 [Mycena sp. CBHHK59/15]